ncbi:jg15791 [Pararge aegeria aegeria]|uniref:Jg15791 protein n=1 Tax=Pararge aegeria aegeria TaxID=348720 RepID=A0A8S4QXD2_9NEOP|nr:jg15791 [Pararge aegeria aegeria]
MPQCLKTKVFEQCVCDDCAKVKVKVRAMLEESTTRSLRNQVRRSGEETELRRSLNGCKAEVAIGGKPMDVGVQMRWNGNLATVNAALVERRDGSMTSGG